MEDYTTKSEVLDATMANIISLLPKFEQARVIGNGFRDDVRTHNIVKTHWTELEEKLKEQESIRSETQGKEAWIEPTQIFAQYRRTVAQQMIDYLKVVQYTCQARVIQATNKQSRHLQETATQ